MDFTSLGAQRLNYVYGGDNHDSYGRYRNPTELKFLDNQPANNGGPKASDSATIPEEFRKYAEQPIKRIVNRFYDKEAAPMLIGSWESKTSLSTTRVRQRLCDLMGTDVIRLNDKRYFQKLSERLQDEYEQTMDKQEDARSAAEEQRIRRLMLEGVIKTPDDYRAVVQGNRTKKPAKKKKKRKSKKRNSDGTPSSVDGTSTGMSHHSDEDKEEPDLVTQVSITSGSRPGSSVPSSRSNRPGSAVRPQSRTQSQSGTHSQSPSPSRPVHYEQENEDSDEDEGFDTKSLPAPSYDRPPSKFSRHENELVKTLRQEETVAGLYSLAEELVSPVKTDELVGKVKVIVKPTKKKMKQQF